MSDVASCIIICVVHYLCKEISAITSDLCSTLFKYIVLLIISKTIRNQIIWGVN